MSQWRGRRGSGARRRAGDTHVAVPRLLEQKREDSDGEIAAVLVQVGEETDVEHDGRRASGAVSTHKTALAQRTHTTHTAPTAGVDDRVDRRVDGVRACVPVDRVRMI